MRRELLRRLLAIPPAVVFVTLLSFAMLSRRAPEGPYDHLPRFVNPAPLDVRARVAAALRALAAGPDDVAAAELARLGGAAFPIVLPALDALEPEARARVAVALAPVGRRMRLAEDVALLEPRVAVPLWTRFWEERALDFRAVAIRRAVKTFVSNPTPLRAQKLTLLDTALLPEIAAELGTDGPLPPAEATELLLPIARHALGLPEPTPGGETSSATWGAALIRFRAAWFARRADFVELDGTARVAATVLETRFGKWAVRAAAQNLDGPPGDASVLEQLLRGGAWTLRRVLLGMTLGLGIGATLGLASAIARRRPLDALIALALATAAAAPSALIARPWPNGSELGSVVAVAGVSAFVAFAVFRRRLMEAAASEPATAARARGASRARVVASALRHDGAKIFFALLSLELPLSLGAALVAEKALGLRGLRDVAAGAVAARDLATLMGIAALSTAGVALGLFLSRVFELIADPRVTGTGS